MFFLVMALWLPGHKTPFTPAYTTPAYAASRHVAAAALTPVDTTDDDLAGGGGDTGGDSDEGLAIDPELTKVMQVQLTKPAKPVTVGDHFKVTVHAHVPANLVDAVRFPDMSDLDPDELTSVDSIARTVTPRGGYVDMAVTYTFAPWTTGWVDLVLGQISVGNHGVAIPDDSIMVQSLLPVGAEKPQFNQLKVKDPRDLMKEPLPVRIRRVLRVLRTALINPQQQPGTAISLWFAILALIGGGVWLWWWRRRSTDEQPIPTREWVEREFQRVESMHLLEKGEPELYTILMSDILRKYLIRTFPSVRASATTHEVAAALRKESLIPADRVLGVYERVDLLKFAHAAMQTQEAQVAGSECRGIVHEILRRHEAAVIALEEQRRADAGGTTPSSPPSGRKQAA